MVHYNVTYGVVHVHEQHENYHVFERAHSHVLVHKHVHKHLHLSQDKII